MTSKNKNIELTSSLACSTHGARVANKQKHLLLTLTLLSGIAISTLPSITLGDDLVAKEYSITPNKRIEAVIAGGELNRIYTGSLEIMEIVGDESKYSLHWSSDYRNFFIFPKVEVGEIIEISLVTSGGITQDIRFTVGDCSARSIFLSKGIDNAKNSSNFPYESEYQDQTNLNHNLKYEIDAMIRSMQIEDEGKYYVLDNKRIISHDKQLLIKQEKSYRWKNINGAVLTLKNKTRKIVSLSEEDIKSKFANVVAANLYQKELSPRGSTKMLVITKEADDV